MEDRTRTTTYPTETAPFGVFTVSGSQLADVSNYWPSDNAYLTGTSTLKVHSKTTVDRVTPGFKRLQANAVVVCNPFYRIETIAEATAPSRFHHTYKSGNLYYKTGGEWRFSVPAFLPGPSDETKESLRESVKNLAVTTAHANINSEEILALATVAESRKTVESVAAISWRLFKILRNMRKFNLRALKREISPKELADRWMEARYAIRPLAYDIQGVFKSMARPRQTERRTYRGYASDGWHVANYLVDQPNGLSSTVSTFLLETDYVVSARAGVLCDADVTYQSILGTNHIFETAWELIPFSFIVDWFANVGDWIAAHTPDVGVRQLASWVTVKSELVQSRKAVSTRSTLTAPNATYSLSPPPMVSTYKELVLERIPDPQMSVFPRFKMNLDAFKLTDIGIILRKWTK